MMNEENSTNPGLTATLNWTQVTLVSATLMLVLLAVYAQTAMSMVDIWWRSETFAHGFLIIPISLYLLWTKRAELVRLQPEPSLSAALLLFLAGGVWMLAELTDVQVVRQAMLIAMISGMVWVLLGWTIVRALLFPLCFLFFAVPVGEALIPPMMDFTAWFTVKMLQFTGIPVYKEGTFFQTPTGNWSVVEGCSGLRYLISSITLGTLYAYITYRRLSRRLLFVLASIVVPIIANGLRAYMIVMIAHLSDMKLALGVDHYIYGWVFFGFVMLILFWIGARWREDDEPEQASAVEDQTRALITVPARQLGVVTVAALLAIAVWPVTAALLQGQLAHDYQLSLDTPQATAGWQVSEAELTDWRPRYLGSDASLHQSYMRDGKQVQLSLEYYYAQRQDAELINSQNVMVRQKHPVWRQVKSEVTTLDLPDGPIEVRVAVLRSAEQNLLVYYWNWVGGSFTSNHYLAKLLDAKGKLFGDDRAAAIIIATEYDDAMPDNGQDLRQFAREMLPAIEKILQAAVPANDRT